MLPSSPVPPMGGGGSPAPMPPGGAGGGASPEGEMSTEEVRQMLTQVLRQAKQIADQHGIDLASLIPSSGGEGAGMGAGGGASIPPPPKSPSPMPPM